MFGKVIAAVTSIAFCGAAVAADLPAKAPAYVNPTPASMWDGLYIGAHGGYASGDADTLAFGASSGSPKGGFGGFQAGYNYMFAPNWLLGSEIDASFGNVEGDMSPAPNSTFEAHTFGTVRGRLGYVWGPWLFYGTAGTAWARTEWADTPRTLVGWAGGLGLEYAFAPRWSAKVEYLYADFGESRRTVGGVLPINFDLTMSMARVGLNYHFGAAGNVATALPATAAAPASRWNGPYIGLHGGYGKGNYDASLAGGQTNLDPSGGFGGFQTGYNWRFAPDWVLGLETDASWGSIRDSGGGFNVKIDAMGTARGRLGYAMNNTLLYGTGGLAWAHIKSATTGPMESDDYAIGWTAGGGVEYQFAPRWSAKIEYAYMDFDKAKEPFLGPITINEKLDVQTVKIGLNYQASLFSLFTGR
jgi:outer membrane immunogenic protein